MKLRFVFFLFLLTGCVSQKDSEIPETGESSEPVITIERGRFGRRAVHCLRDFLVGEDAGGTWEKVSGPAVPALTGDNPCFEWDTQDCGLYTFKYKIITTCCSDSTVFDVLKCCVAPGTQCE